MPLHIGKGHTIAEALGRSTDYIKNPEKTDGGELVSFYECDPLIADAEFLFSKRLYATKTGKDQGEHDVIAYHMRQSFKPGEVDPAVANKIGYDLAMSLTKGKYAFMVCTHIDRQHIHSHVIFNSTSLDSKRKFRNFWGSSFAIRRISDKLCLENGLSIIENPKPSRGHYGKWLGDEKPLSWREKLRQSIDNILYEKPTDFETFIINMKSVGYEAKTGKHLAFSAEGQKRFVRCKSLGDDYTEQAIRERIDGKRIVAPKQSGQTKVNLMIDIQNNLKAKDSPGYEHWAKVFNLQQGAKTLIFLEENDLEDYEKLSAVSARATQKFKNISSQIKDKENRLKEISEMQKYISQYSRTRDVYAEYKKSGYSKKYLADHESDIILHKAAKNFFDNHIDKTKNKKLPSMNNLKIEYATLLAEKKKLYSEYRPAKEEMQKLSIAKANADYLFNKKHQQKNKDIER